MCPWERYQATSQNKRQTGSANPQKANIRRKKLEDAVFHAVNLSDAYPCYFLFKIAEIARNSKRIFLFSPCSQHTERVLSLL
jgi:hypothetical protein